MSSTQRIVAYRTDKRPKSIKNHVPGSLYAEINPNLSGAVGIPPEGVQFEDFLGIYTSKDKLKKRNSNGEI